MQILCRGKREVDGIWIEWLYSHKSFCGKSYPYIKRLTDLENYGDWAIIPETVGRFTGFQDINNKEIFEGDICRVAIYDYATGQPVSVSYCVVVFDEFKIGVRHGVRGEVSTFKEFVNTEFEVVGNIFDNPELIAAKK